MLDDTALSAELYGLGVGPGAPGLLTLEAARVLERVDLVFAPAPRRGESSLAWQIAAADRISEEKLRIVSFPMTRDADELSSSWREAARGIAAELDRGRKAAFVTLGDPSIYSTWGYLRAELLALRPSSKIATVPGIPAFAAAAAKLGIGLVEADERLLLLPLPSALGELDALIGAVDTLAIYKIGARLPELADYLRAKGLEGSSWLAEGVELPREKLGPFAEVARKAEGYLSLAIVKTGRKS
jgi:precorrin-2/cobalt-factor-2 C20-methyltransferase